MNWLVIVHNLVPRALFPGFGGGAGKRKSALGRGWIVQGLWSWLSWIVTKVNHNVLYISPRKAPRWSGAKKRGLEEAWRRPGVLSFLPPGHARPRSARFSVSPHSTWEAVRRLILNRQIPSLKHASVHDVPARAIVMLSSSFWTGQW